MQKTKKKQSKKKREKVKKKKDFSTKKYGPEYLEDLEELELINGEEENE